jgi:hypothetical protein
MQEKYFERCFLIAALQGEIPTEEPGHKPSEFLYHGSCETSTALQQAQKRSILFCDEA